MLCTISWPHTRYGDGVSLGLSLWGQTLIHPGLLRILFGRCKNWFLPYTQPNKLMCHMGAGRRHKTLGSETRTSLFRPQQVTMSFVSTLPPLLPKCHGTVLKWMLHTWWVCVSAEKPGLKKISYLIKGGVSKLAQPLLQRLCAQETNPSSAPERDIIFIWPGCLLYKCLCKDSPEQSLSIPLLRNGRNTRTPWRHCLSARYHTVRSLRVP